MRWTIIFMKMKFVVNALTMSEDSVTCISAKEDKHQNIMSNVDLEKRVKEQWTLARVAKFIDLVGVREITLKAVQKSPKRMW